MPRTWVLNKLPLSFAGHLSPTAGFLACSRLSCWPWLGILLLPPSASHFLSLQVSQGKCKPSVCSTGTSIKVQLTDRNIIFVGGCRAWLPEPRQSMGLLTAFHPLGRGGACAWDPGILPLFHACVCVEPRALLPVYQFPHKQPERWGLLLPVLQISKPRLQEVS